MAAPIHEKTWTITETAVPYTSEDQNNKESLLALKNALVSGGFSVTQCCYFTGSIYVVAAGDQWTTISNIGFNSSGSPHSWIVLANSTLAPNFELCIDCVPGGGFGSRLAARVVSWNVGFSGGSPTNRPTASDQTTLNSSYYITTGNYGTNYVYGITSSDGLCNRVVMTRNGWCHSFNLFDRIKNPVVSAQPYPIFALSAYATQTQLITYGTWNDSASVSFRSHEVLPLYPSFSGSAYMTSQGDTSQALGQAMTYANELNGAWELVRVRGYCDSRQYIGMLGDFYDLYWCSTTINPGDLFPTAGDPPAGRWASFGDLVFPWDNTTIQGV